MKMSKKEDIKLNIPNLISLARLICVPLTVWLILNGEILFAFWVFVSAGISDAVDGFIAKRFNLQTELGNWVENLEEEVVHKEKPFLGICLGMHLLATTGSENGLCDGLNWIPGIVEQIKCNSQETRVPHIGWSDVQITIKGGIYAGLEKNQCFYFLHSYILTPVRSDVVSATCKHGIEFVASIEINNIYATQFHPEKSQRAGLAVIDNFLKI